MREGTPRVGQIVDHYFLWSDEKAQGNVEARKPRPCVVLVVEARENNTPRVVLVPVTSQPPRSGTSAIRIPPDVLGQAGLDETRDAWIVFDEVNIFAWPGFDLVPQKDGSFVRGFVSARFFAQVREAVLGAYKSQRLRLTNRDEE
jgi:uncharacterized protein YifN (PemK superfamily)